VKAMKVVFRADASLQIGSGHVMRCLTLADALRSDGAECHFICREHPGNLVDVIRERGYRVHGIAFSDADNATIKSHPSYLSWLGSSQELDAEESLKIVELITPDWLVVDHYALDATWEERLKTNNRNLLVLDDLADRQHVSDILLDQTFGRNTVDYLTLIPEGSIALCGSDYALLRPDFKKLRHYSLNRRAGYTLKNIFISLGGVDRNNVTQKVLESLKVSVLPKSCSITVVMGPTAPWLKDIQRLARTMPWSMEVKVGVNNMAQLMADSDLAIGAAGSTSWERCCLGVPTAMVVLAENQKFAADLLVRAKAVVRLSVCNINYELAQIIEQAVECPGFLRSISEHARSITVGAGCERVLNAMFNFKYH
jgi:UDP-2,4-diacetamido-2,4,6-trideoxy-beta-L-altropyranose hydrolase